MRKKLLGRVSITSIILTAFLILNFTPFIEPLTEVMAETASAVTIGEINYNELTIQIYNNNNPVVYYSVNGTAWTEVDSAYSSSTKSYTMDISWISNKTDTTIYFMGNIVTDIVDVTVPKLGTEFNVTYSNLDEDFIFDNTEDADSFEWRKASDYNWNSVSLDFESASYKAFLALLDKFRVKGAKIIIRLPQVVGSQDDAGRRPSKEITITITTRAEAPSIKVNSSKLTVNTSASLEYYDSTFKAWMDCTNTMYLSEIAPKVLYESGSRNVILMIRKSATATTPYSETAYVMINGQTAAPQIGDNSKDVTYYYVNSKLTVVFNKAAVDNIYEYSIIRDSDEFDYNTAKWITVNNKNVISLSSSIAPEGCTIYVRKKGIDADSTRKINLLLPSAVSSFTVSY